MPWNKNHIHNELKKGVSYFGSFLVRSRNVWKTCAHVTIFRFAKPFKKQAHTHTNFPPWNLCDGTTSNVQNFGIKRTDSKNWEQWRMWCEKERSEKERKEKRNETKKTTLLVDCEMRKPQPFDNVIIREEKKNSQWRYFCVPWHNRAHHRHSFLKFFASLTLVHSHSLPPPHSFSRSLCYYLSMLVHRCDSCSHFSHNSQIAHLILSKWFGLEANKKSIDKFTLSVVVEHLQMWNQSNQNVLDGVFLYWCILLPSTTSL